MSNHNLSRHWPALLLTGILASILLAAKTTHAAENELYTFFRAEEFGYRIGDGDSFNWDAEGWVGGDYNKLWFKTEGEQVNGSGLKTPRCNCAGRLIADFWDLQAGLRYDFNPEPERSFAVIGVEGLAPYWFEIDASAFISDQGDVSPGSKRSTTCC